jgi:hypothetical protein
MNHVGWMVEIWEEEKDTFIEYLFFSAYLNLH